MQKEKEEDQRGQGRDLRNCLGCKMEREEVRFRSGCMEREERERVRVKRVVAMSMFAIRRALTSASCLILTRVFYLYSMLFFLAGSSKFSDMDTFVFPFEILIYVCFLIFYD